MRLLRHVALVVMVALLMATLLAPAASANVSQGWVAGGGIITNDWNDEPSSSGVLNQWPNSNAAGLWQIVLYADGYLSLGDIDCRFGPQTKAATREWQTDHNYAGDTPDGLVGRRTFGHASSHLRTHSNPELSSIKIYNGTVRDVSFIRSGNGQYRILDRYIAPSDPDGSHVASYFSRASDC